MQSAVLTTVLSLVFLVPNTEIVISRPVGVEQAYLYFDFNENCETPAFNAASSWPTQWHPMTKGFRDGTHVFTFSFNTQESAAFLFYKIRYVYVNRTLGETAFLPQIWNTKHLQYYYNYVYWTNMCLIVLGIMSTLFLILFSCKKYGITLLKERCNL